MRKVSRNLFASWKSIVSRIHRILFLRESNQECLSAMNTPPEPDRIMALAESIERHGSIFSGTLYRHSELDFDAFMWAVEVLKDMGVIEEDAQRNFRWILTGFAE